MQWVIMTESGLASNVNGVKKKNKHTKALKEQPREQHSTDHLIDSTYTTTHQRFKSTMRWMLFARYAIFQPDVSIIMIVMFCIDLYMNAVIIFVSKYILLQFM